MICCSFVILGQIFCSFQFKTCFHFRMITARWSDCLHCSKENLASYLSNCFGLADGLEGQDVVQHDCVNYHSNLTLTLTC